MIPKYKKKQLCVYQISAQSSLDTRKNSFLKGMSGFRLMFLQIPTFLIGFNVYSVKKKKFLDMLQYFR